MRQKDLDSFLDYTRMKFVGFTLKDDRTTLAGLPEPIHEGVRILNSHMYKSLAELQIDVSLNVFIKKLKGQDLGLVWPCVALCGLVWPCMAFV